MQSFISYCKKKQSNIIFVFHSHNSNSPIVLSPKNIDIKAETCSKTYQANVKTAHENVILAKLIL